MKIEQLSQCGEFFNIITSPSGHASCYVVRPGYYVEGYDPEKNTIVHISRIEVDSTNTKAWLKYDGGCVMVEYNADIELFLFVKQPIPWPFAEDVDDMYYDVLSAPPGTKIKFLNKNGWNDDVPNAVKRGLVPDAWYTLEYVEVGDSSSVLGVEEVKGDFNTVMFECAPYEKPFHGWLGAFYYRRYPR